MKAQRFWKTVLAVAILAFATAAFILPQTSVGDPDYPYEHLVRTPEAIQKQNDGFCASQPGTNCYQICIDFQGSDHLMPEFECH